MKRSDLAGYAGYGYCASHSRWFWGLRLAPRRHPRRGCRSPYALTSPKTDERDVARDLLETPTRPARHPSGQILMADKGYRSAEFDTELNALGDHA